MPTNIGRIDAVWQVPDGTVVSEIKYHVNRPLDKLLDEAMKQIHDRRYHEAYFTGGKKVILNVGFSGRNVGCRMNLIER